MATTPDPTTSAHPLEALLRRNDTAAPYPDGRTLHGMVAEQAARRPDAVAVSRGDRVLTYDALLRRAGALASRLRDEGLGPGDLVALSVERDVDMAVGALGILWCGAGYVPVDPTHPAERLAFVLRDAGAAAVVTQRRLRDRLGGDHAVLLDDLPDDPPAPPEPAGEARDTALLIYTSGTTGRPKGARLAHRGLVNLVHGWASRPGFRAGDAMLAVSSLSFDMAILDLFLPLVAGGRSVIAGRETTADGRALARAMERHAITFLLSTPSTLRLLLDGGWRPTRPVTIVSGGEPLTRDVAGPLLAAGVRLWNGYGVTEASACSTLDRVEDADGPAPIGRPSPNCRVYVLDEDRRPVADGVTGDLWIGGVGVADGYHRRPDLTAERFVPDPFADDGAAMYRTGDLGRWRPDGRIEHLGRADDQVKIRGVRVEPGEVEAALRDHGDVRAAAVVPVDAGPGDRRLVAWIVPAEGGERGALPDRLRAHVAGRLPSAFVPSGWGLLDALPLNPSGKVDRRALASRGLPAGPTAGGGAAPGDAEEEILCRLVGEVLGRGPVGVDDRFLQVGGHSLLATRLACVVRDALGVDLPLRDVLEDGRPSHLARRVRALREGDSDEAFPPVAARRGPGPHPLSFPQGRLWFVHRLAPDRVEYNTPILLRLDGPLDEAALRGALDALVERHAVLRSTVAEQDGVPLQVVSEPAPLPLAVRDLRDRIDEDREAAAEAVAREVARRPFDLASEWPLRAALVRVSDAEHRLVLSLHHVASDGRTLHVLVDDLAALYAERAAGAEGPPPLPVQYSDWARWQREVVSGARLEGLLRWWRETLDDAPPRLALPTRRPRPERRDVAGARRPFVLDPDTARAVHALARRTGSTPYMVLLAAFAALLRAETGQEDLPLGTLVANRRDAALERLVGFFANTLVTRVRAEGAASWRDLLERTREATLGALAHQDLPFEALVRDLRPERTEDQQPLVQVCFVLQESPRHAATAGDLRITAEEGDVGAAPFDLLVEVWEAPGPDGTPGFEGRLTHRTDVLDEAVAARLATRFAEVVARVAAAPQIPLDDLAPPGRDDLEARVLADPGVADAAVGPRPCADGRTEQVAWVVGRLRGDAPEGVDRVVPVAALPLTPDGRPDRAALARTPVVDDDVAARAEEVLRAAAGVEAVRVETAPLSVSVAALHAADLLDAAPEPATPPPPEPTSDRPEGGGTGRLSLREGPPLVIPADAPATLPEILRRATEAAPDRGVRCLEADGSEAFLAWPDLLAEAERIAGGLAAAGVERGAPLVLAAARHGDFVAALWGGLLHGAVVVPIAPPAPGDAAGSRAERLLGVWASLVRPPILVDSDTGATLREAAAQGGDVAPRLLDVRSLRAAAPPEIPHAPGPDDPALLLLTSGSTGVPKAVTHTHRTVRAFLAAYGGRHGFGPDDVFLNWLGLDHVAPLFMCHLSAAWSRASQVNAPLDHFLADPAVALDWADRFGATTTFLANFAFGLMNEAVEAGPPRDWDLSRFRCLANGGESIVARTARRFLEILSPYGLPPTAMVPIWGMSETGSATITSLDFTREGTSDDDPFVAIGDPVAGFAMRVVDDSGGVVPEGVVGRLQVRGEQVLTGYWGRPDADAESFTGDGWFDTGDLAFIDEGGLTLTGRAKDVIIIHGVNHYAHDLEAAVEAIPGVARSFVAACAVRPPGAQTDRVALFFAAPEVDEADLPAVMRRVRAVVTRHVGMPPAHVLPVAPEVIPKTEIGKIQRTRLRDALEAGDLDDAVRRADVLEGGEQTVPDWFLRRTWRPRPTSGRAAPVRLRILKAGPLGALIAEGLHALLPPGEPPPDAPPVVVDLRAFDAERDALGAAWDLVADVRDLAAADRPGALVLATPPVQPVRPGDEVSPALAPTLGLLATIPHEHPRLAVRHVDLEPAAPEETARRLDAELRDLHRDEREVAWRDGERLVARLAPADLPDAAPDPLPVGDGAPVLVTGGLGGIGRLIAADLMERGARVLALGRTPERALPDEARDALADLRARGDVAYEAVDVADADALDAAVAHHEVRWGRPLAGAVHLAAVMPAVTLARETREGLAAAFAPRVDGLRALGGILAAREDTFLVDFASVNALLGGFGAGAYAAASRFGESFGHALSAEHGVRVHHLAWSRWDGIGLTRDLPADDLARTHGYLPVDGRRGLLSMWASVARSRGATIVGLDRGHARVRRHLDRGPVGLRGLEAEVVGAAEGLRRRIRVRDDAGVPVPLAVRRVERLSDSSASGAATRPGEATPADDRERRLADIWRQVLDVERVGAEDNFFDLGGHSLLLARLQRRVEDAYGREVPMVTLFRHPTVRALAGWLGAAGDEGGDEALVRARERAGRQRRRKGRRRRGRGRRRGDDDA
ncbi:MAG: amino acid adenylation domain-containing protein [Myxococcota bacterium]